MKQFLIIALLSFLTLVSQSTMCMDLGRAAQESPEQFREQARGHDHPLIGLSSQDQKNLEEIIEVLSQSKELLQDDLYHEDRSNKPAAPVAQPGQVEDMEMWLISGRDPGIIPAMLSLVLSHQDPHNHFYQAPPCIHTQPEQRGVTKSVLGVLKRQGLELKSFECIREYLNVADDSPKARAAFLEDDADKKEAEKEKTPSGSFVDPDGIIVLLDE